MSRVNGRMERIERDALGERALPTDALYGIHTQRARENFSIAGRTVHPALLHAFGAVKLACARANHEVKPWPAPVFHALQDACLALWRGELDEHLDIDALQGGAGTSTNMAVNEVLANEALRRLGHRPGQYDLLHPLDDLNRSQSTNDVYPTALRVAAIEGVQGLDEALTGLTEVFQRQEQAMAHVVRVGRTELRDAVLTTMGRAMSAYAEVFARDRWRIAKCRERLRVVNLGGGAIGTGLGAPRAYIFTVTDRLRELTGLPLARADNLQEATQNQDALLETGGMLKTCAANLLKVANDLRWLSSGPDAGLGEIVLPAIQAGSSAMPGKVNPVIPEAVAQAAMQYVGRDVTLTMACAGGNLELNAFMPLIADTLLHGIDELTRASRMLAGCVRSMTVDEARCRAQVEGAVAVATAIAPAIGYDRAAEAARMARDDGKTVRAVVTERGWLAAEAFDEWTSPEAVLRLGHAPVEPHEETRVREHP